MRRHFRIFIKQRKEKIIARAEIHAETKGEGAMIRVQGKPIEVINLAIQITGSVIADMPKLMQPYIIGCVQKSIPLAVENDAVAERRNSEDEEWQKPEPAEPKKPEPEKNEEKHTAHTAGFFMAKEVAKADPEFRRFLRDILADLDKEEG